MALLIHGESAILNGSSDGWGPENGKEEEVLSDVRVVREEVASDIHKVRSCTDAERTIILRSPRGCWQQRFPQDYWARCHGIWCEDRRHD